VALGANFGAEYFLGRTGIPGITASTNNLGIRVIIRMKIFFHVKTIPSQE
jgi:hypothetical protein